jgi:DNA modification methylase
MNIYIGNALDFDYSTIDYDTVFSSPPYYFIEKYPNNLKYESKKQMNDNFYMPLFTKTYEGLKPGGVYVINICKQVYDDVLKKLFGEATDIFPLKISKRQNNYQEMIYVWYKK